MAGHHWSSEDFHGLKFKIWWLSFEAYLHIIFPYLHLWTFLLIHLSSQWPCSFLALSSKAWWIGRFHALEDDLVDSNSFSILGLSPWTSLLGLLFSPVYFWRTSWGESLHTWQAKVLQVSLIRPWWPLG